uniref:Uncharacterized protein n=1 Tax=Sus scrofa TaxID=9823 RepID=A0A8D1EQP0_PIG
FIFPNNTVKLLVLLLAQIYSKAERSPTEATLGTSSRRENAAQKVIRLNVKIHEFPLWLSG